MANNRMYLVNVSTGQRIVLAKHMAGAWYVPDGESNPSGLSGRLNEMFEDELSTDRVHHDQSIAGCGSLDWRIEYEHVDTGCSHPDYPPTEEVTRVVGENFKR